MRSSFWSLLTLVASIATTASATPLVRRYDLDKVGIPDYCYDEGSVTNCMLPDGSWTALPRINSVTVTKIGPKFNGKWGPYWGLRATTSTSTATSTLISTTTIEASTPSPPPAYDVPVQPAPPSVTTTTTTTTTITTTTTSSIPLQLAPSSTTQAPPAFTPPLATSSTTSQAPLTHNYPQVPPTDAPQAATSTSTSTSSSQVPSSALYWASPSSNAYQAPSSSAPVAVAPSSTSVPAVPSSSTVQAVPSSSPSQSTSPSTGNTSSGKLPTPAQWKLDKGVKWDLEYVGDIQFAGGLAGKDVVGDKCRTGKIGDKVIWNCGDIGCNPDVLTCGFSMGPAFYGTNDVMTIDSTGVHYVQENDFLKPWSGDPVFGPPYQYWGMDTSNVAPINDTHGVAYAWQIYRGAPNNGHEDRGNAVAIITLGDNKPIATRVGPLLTGPDKIALGLIAILRVEDYIYIYSDGGPSTVMIGRVHASDDVFDASKYEFLEFGSSGTWVPGIPSKTSNSYGATSLSKDKTLGCDQYGSAFYNNYLQKYVLLCNIFMDFVKFYTSDTPYGPWSDEYSLASGPSVQGMYGVHAHPEYSPGGSDKSFYFSMGPNTKMHMYKVTLGY